jgi:hypothetical protein
MLARRLAHRQAEKFWEDHADELPGQDTHSLAFERDLPLDNLNENILCADALFTPWPEADAIIGNPPYLGSRYLAKEHGYEYARKVYAAFPDVPKMADFCVHWFRLAHDRLKPGGRAGLVGTKTIRQNESREASLDYIVQNAGIITEAVSTQVWSGEAQVHVSLVNWVKPPDPIPSTFWLPQQKKLFTQLGDAKDSPWKCEEAERIGPTLSVGLDVTSARRLQTNENPKLCFVGQYPFNAGFMLTPEEAAQMLKQEPSLRDVLFPYIIGDDLVAHGMPTRWIIDFAQREMTEAMRYKTAFERVKKLVMPEVLAKAEAEKKATGKDSTRWTRMANRWWQFRDYQPGTMAAIGKLPRYIACPRVTKRPVFEFISSGVHPDNALAVFAFSDDYSFGILQSGIHWAWFTAKCSTLTARFRYTSDTVFDTFPWPQSPTLVQVKAVAEAAVSLRALRREIMAANGWSLRDLYRTLETPGTNRLRDAQAALDSAVRAAYGMNESEDPLGFLLRLNLELAALESKSGAITAPGLPGPISSAKDFVTDDCVEPPD